MLLSVIIPVYNGEKYIQGCVTSVLNQKNKNLEIIIINDGSTDHTYELCKKLAKEDIRIKILNKANCGVASARNDGIRSAKGKYLIFLDSDDIWDRDFYNNEIEDLLKKDYDMIGFTYGVANEKMSRFIDKPICDEVIMNCEDSKKVTINYGRHHSSYAIKKDIVDKNEIIISGIRNEDEIFRNKCLYKSNVIRYFNKNIFYYRNNPQSVTHQKIDIEKVYKGIIDNWLEAKEWFYKQNEKDTLIQEHCDNMIASLVMEMIRETCKSDLVFNIRQKSNIPRLYEEYLPIIIGFSWNTNLVKEYKLYTSNSRIYTIKYYLLGRIQKIYKYISNEITLIDKFRNGLRYRNILDMHK